MQFPLTTIDVNVDESKFNHAVFSSLLKCRAFALSGLPLELSRSVAKMYKLYEDFLDTADTNKHKFLAQPRIPPGLHIDKEVLMGARGYRYYVCSDNKGAIEQSLPSDDQHENPWRENCESIHHHCRLLTDKVSQAIDSGLIAGGGTPIGKYFTNLNIASSWHRYVALKDSEIRKIRQESPIIADEESQKVISFSAHQDLGGMTFLFYSGNKTKGLQGIYGKDGTYCNIELEEDGENLHAFVVTGLLMERLTAGKILALDHRVTSRNETEYKSRSPLINFINLDEKTVLPETVMLDGKKYPQQTSSEFFQQIFADKSAYLHANYDDLSPGKL